MDEILKANRDEIMRLHNANLKLHNVNLKLTKELEKVKSREVKIAENVTEIAWTFDGLVTKKKITDDWEYISDEFSNGSIAGSDIVRNDIYKWAKEFEDTWDPDADEPYTLAIQEFAERKLIEKYGIKKTFTIEFEGKFTVEAKSKSEANKMAEEIFKTMHCETKKGEVYEI